MIPPTAAHPQPRRDVYYSIGISPTGNLKETNRGTPRQRLPGRPGGPGTRPIPLYSRIPPDTLVSGFLPQAPDGHVHPVSPCQCAGPSEDGRRIHR